MNKQSQLIDQALELLGSIFRSMKSTVRQAGTDGTLTYTEMRILFTISQESDGITIKNIAHFFDISSSAATQFIDKLSEKGLIIRQLSPDDRREACILLSQKAKKSLRALKKRFYANLKPLFAEFSPQELNQLVQLLTKIHATKRSNL